MQILVVSGFLGAGKTTFIKELSRRTKKTIAIMENEYGSENIDGNRLINSPSTTNKSINIFELSEGCICCSTKNEIALSIVTIANTINPDILVIEPTGLASLTNIIFNLKKIEYAQISILNPITIVDIKSFKRFKEEYKDIYLDQIKTAGNIIVTKAKNSGLEEKNNLKAFINNINSNASITLEDYNLMPNSWWNDIIKHKKSFHEINVEQIISKHTDQLTLKNISLPSENLLLYLLDGICHGRYGNIIRGKGNFKAGNQFLKFDYVDKNYSINGLDGSDGSSLVFIGSDIDKPSIEKLFTKNPIQLTSIIKKLPIHNLNRN